MQVRDQNMHDQGEIPASNTSLAGVWVKRYTFSLNMGGDGVVNAKESFRFGRDGIAEYGYGDDSGIQTASSEKYLYKVDGNRLILSTDSEDDVNYFRIVGNRLILTDDRHRFREEYIFESPIK